jgi:DNA-directed RNA polymerase subunit RPC12/RpoP
VLLISRSNKGSYKLREIQKKSNNTCNEKDTNSTLKKTSQLDNNKNIICMDNNDGIYDCIGKSKRIASIENEDMSKLKYTCGTCGKNYSQAPALYRHKAMVHHNKDYRCKLCSKIFPRKDNLRTHILMIHGPGVD